MVFILVALKLHWTRRKAVQLEQATQWKMGGGHAEYCKNVATAFVAEQAKLSQPVCRTS